MRFHLHDNAQAHTHTHLKNPALEHLIHCNLENALRNEHTDLQTNEVENERDNRKSNQIEAQ